MSRLRCNIPFFLTVWIFTQAQWSIPQPSQAIPAKFRHERSIVPGAPGPNRLRIDAALLAGANADWQFARQITGSER